MLDAKRIKNQIGADLVISLQDDICLKRLNIPQRRLNLFYKLNKIKYIRLPITEFDPDDLTNKLIGATDIAQPYIDDANRVYIHCNQGMERAPSFLVTYLVRYENFPSVDEAVDFVKEKRACTPVIDSISEAIYGVDEQV